MAITSLHNLMLPRIFRCLYPGARLGLLLLVSSAYFLITGCDKYIAMVGMAIVDTGTIRYTNNSNNGYDYEIFLDGASLKLLPVNTYYDHPNVPVGTHIVKAVKRHWSSHIDPRQTEKTLTVTKGVIINFSFP